MGEFAKSLFLTEECNEFILVKKKSQGKRSGKKRGRKWKGNTKRRKTLERVPNGWMKEDKRVPKAGR